MKKNRMPNYYREMFWYKLSRIKKWFRKRFESRGLVQG